MSLLGILIVLWGHAVGFEFSNLGLGGLPRFLLTCVVTFVSLAVISVQVEICGISVGSIGLSYAIGWD